jgi:hypothetical protein
MRSSIVVPISALLGAVLQLTISNAARSDPNNAGTCQSMLRLNAFVSERTSYTTTQNCLRVVRATRTELRSWAAHKTQIHSGEPLAIHVPFSGEIIVSLEIDLSNPLGHSYLVHELVHAQQIENGVHSVAPCLGWLEGEAYRIQAEYLRLQGAAEDAFQVEILGLLQGACANAYHPELILR